MEDSHNYSNDKKKLGYVLSSEITVDEHISLKIPSIEDAKILFQLVEKNRDYLRAVSYTHLTLPTTSRV